MVYAYDSNYTKYSAKFEIIGRNKPENYVYTETEVLNYNVLLDRINEVDENIGETVNDYIANNDLGYVKPEELEEAISAIPPTDLSNYYNKEEVNALIPSTSGLATESYVEEKINALNIPSIEGLATEEYVIEVMSGIPEPDLSQYAKIDDLENFALKSDIPSTDGLATETYVDNAIATIPKVDLSEYAKITDIPDVSNFATKDEIPSIEGLASTKYVDDAISAIDIPSADLSNYYTKSEVDTAISSAIGAIVDGEEVSY